MRQFFSFAFLSAISYLCHRVFDKSKWNTKDTAFKVDKSLPRLLPYAVCQIVRFDWNFWWQKVPKTARKSGRRLLCFPLVPAASLPVRIIFRAHRARRSPPGGGLGRTKHKMSINPIKETKHLPIRKRILVITKLSLWHLF